MSQFDFKHGLWDSNEYKIWVAIKQRCLNPKNDNYPRYGAKGVTICKEWQDSFLAFFTDMGVRPSLNHSVDRIDNKLGYSAANCKWSTRSQQNMNVGKKKGDNKYRGVSFRKDKNKYRAYFRHEGKQVSCGLFDDELIASLMHDYHSLVLRKDLRYLNHPHLVRRWHVPVLAVAAK